MSKNSRILAMFKSLSSGEIFVAPECRDEVFTQILQFNPLKTNNTDDVLDLLTYANKVIEMFSDYIVAVGELVTGEHESIEILPPEATSPF